MQEIPIGHSNEMFAAIHPERGVWRHFFGARAAYSCAGDKPENVRRVRVTIDPEGPYWGWWYSTVFEPAELRNRISMVFDRQAAVEMCFPYGTRAEEERDYGRVVRLRVEEIPE